MLKARNVSLRLVVATLITLMIGTAAAQTELRMTWYDDGSEGQVLRDLLDRYGAAHPAPGSSHYSGRIGRHFLKWEMHTEFVTYPLFSDSLDERPFSGEMTRMR